MINRYAGPARQLVLLAALLLSAAACGAMRGGGNMAEVTIIVANDISAASSLTVWALPQGGIRNLLGTVGANDTVSFTFQTTRTQYQLRGQTLSGEDLLSPPFTVRPSETLRWNIRANTVVPISTGR